MSEEQLKAFLEKVNSDTELQEKLRTAASPEAGLEIAKEAGFSITSEDIQTMQSATGEVSDKELEEAAGGVTVIVCGGIVTAIALYSMAVCHTDY